MTCLLRQLSVVLLSVVVWGIPCGVSAQTGLGRLNGRVVDPQHAVLPGVAITVSSPALIGQQTLLTESDGRYQFPALPSGVYAVTFELVGFRTLTREGIVITLNNTMTVDVDLELASLAESVVVRGAAPVVDSTTEKVGAHFSAKVMAAVPTATDMWALLSLTPGIRLTNYDVGGSSKDSQGQYTSFGVSDQNQIISDGVDHTEGTGGAGLYADFYANDEVSISSVGNDVETFTPGASVVATVKSGGNEFTGFFHISYDSDHFIGNNLTDELEARGATPQRVLKFWEGHADLGGPIVKDKLWFFGAANHFTVDREVTGVPRTVGTDLGNINDFTTKETYRPSQKDTLIGYVKAGQKEKPHRSLSATTGPDSTVHQDGWWRLYQGQHQRVWTNRLFTEARIGASTSHFEFPPNVDPALNPHRVDLATGEVSGAADGYLSERSKPQASVRATYFLPGHGGSHDFKFGFEFVRDAYRYGALGVSQPTSYADVDGQPAIVTFADWGTADTLNRTWTNLDVRNLRSTLFAQDRWATGDRLTITAGVRVDYQKPYDMGGKRDPILTDFFSAKTIPGQTLLQATDIAPRVGMAYRLDRQGKSVLKAFYGRYYHNFADSFSGAASGGSAYQDWEFCRASDP